MIKCSILLGFTLWCHCNWQWFGTHKLGSTVLMVACVSCVMIRHWTKQMNLNIFGPLIIALFANLQNFLVECLVTGSWINSETTTHRPPSTGVFQLPFFHTLFSTEYTVCLKAEYWITFLWRRFARRSLQWSQEPGNFMFRCVWWHTGSVAQYMSYHLWYRIPSLLVMCHHAVCMLDNGLNSFNSCISQCQISLFTTFTHVLKVHSAIFICSQWT